MSLHTEPRTLVLTDPGQLKAIGHKVRTQILSLLETEPMSAKRLSERFDMTHGKVGYHLKILEREGLVKVVEERRVRAMTEKIYAPTYDILRVAVPGQEMDRLQFLFGQASREAAPADRQPFADHTRLYSVRMPRERAAEFARRLAELADEFADHDGEGDLYGLAAAVYAVEVPGEPA